MIFPKFLATAAAAIAITSAATHGSRADTFGDYEYTDNGASVTITRFNSGATGTIVVPAALNGKPVSTIGYMAFAHRAGITSVTIPSGVSTIEEMAFSSCYSLSSIQLPEGLTTIGRLSFRNCPNLKSIHIPSTLVDAPLPFDFSPPLLQVTFAPGIKAIPAGLLADCDKLTEIAIPASVTRIGDSAFYGCRKLRGITLPAGLKVIGTQAFEDCNGIPELAIPSSVTSIGDSAFTNTDLREMTLPQGLKQLGQGVFSRCDKLERVTLPSSLKEIPPSLFLGCLKLETVSIPVGVTRIGTLAFSGCNLARVIFSPKLREIEKEAFLDCGKLRTAVFTGKAPAMGNRVFARTAEDFTIFLEDSATGFTLPRWKGYRTTLPRPEITVQSADGKSLPNESAIFLPSAIIGKTRKSAKVVVLNTGIRPLTELKLTITGDHATDFLVKDFTIPSIAPGKSAVVKVGFAPQHGGKRRSQLKIFTNDQNESPFTINLSGTGVRKN